MTPRDVDQMTPDEIAAFTRYMRQAQKDQARQLRKAGRR